ncbi:hypothetical protein SUDANB15_00185 [Streptomyces sp. enrichment culture]
MVVRAVIAPARDCRHVHARRRAASPALVQAAQSGCPPRLSDRGGPADQVSSGPCGQGRLRTGGRAGEACGTWPRRSEGPATGCGRPHRAVRGGSAAPTAVPSSPTNGGGRSSASAGAPPKNPVHRCAGTATGRPTPTYSKPGRARTGTRSTTRPCPSRRPAAPGSPASAGDTRPRLPVAAARLKGWTATTSSCCAAGSAAPTTPARDPTGHRDHRSRPEGQGLVGWSTASVRARERRPAISWYSGSATMRLNAARSG